MSKKTQIAISILLGLVGICILAAGWSTGDLRVSLVGGGGILLSLGLFATAVLCAHDSHDVDETLSVDDHAAVADGSFSMADSHEQFESSSESDGVTNSAELTSEQDSTNDPLDDTNQLIEDMISQGRYSLLLRPQLINNLSEDQRTRAVQALDEAMTLVPEGEVVLQSWRINSEGEDSESLQRTVRVEALYLDCYPVTNKEFYEFVDAGGYEQMPLWDPSILAGVLDFVDQTGFPGPKLWKDGSYPPGEGDFPVVGVCWHEAAAYSRWVGKRLVTDPEWVKAGCWPVKVADADPVQRRYPWGDSMDRSLTNVWGSGPGKVVSVKDFPGGVSVGGVQQLIGNVWEWTNSDFGIWEVDSLRLESEIPMKSLRGGSFDTYFDNQASCHFQSGDTPVARKYNIGFRCGVGICDLAPILQDFDDEEYDDEEYTDEEYVDCEPENVCDDDQAADEVGAERD